MNKLKVVINWLKKKKAWWWSVTPKLLQSGCNYFFFNIFYCYEAWEVKTLSELTREENTEKSEILKKILKVKEKIFNKNLWNLSYFKTQKIA